jgi:spore coat polysaccharide biosynthesis predicted glycosyltransferase SpsG
MKKIRNVFFRADANSKIGSGHIVRCEIIAETIKQKDEKCNIHFLVKELPDVYKEQLKKKGYTIHFLPKQATTEHHVKTLSGFSSSVLVTDSDEQLYYSKRFQLDVKQQVERLVMITFHNNAHFYADVVHNQNIMAPSLIYDCEPHCTKLLGTKYAVLKEKYRIIAAKQKYKQINPSNLTLMITLGGADISDRTSLVYDALQPLQKWISEIIVVIGGLYKNKLSLEKQIDQSSIPTRLYQNTDKMPELMSKCDIALNSGGLTCWEFGCLGVLNIILPHSKREMLSAEYMDKYNYGYTISVKPNKNIKEAIENILKDNFFERIVRLKKAISVDGVDKLVKKILQ